MGDSGMYFAYVSGQVTIENSTGQIVNVVHAESKGGSPISSAHAMDQAIEEVGIQLGEQVAQSLVSSL